MGLLNGPAVVSGRQLVRQTEPQELGAGYPLHRVGNDGRWEMVTVTSPPKVYHHLLGLVGKLLCCAPGCQLLRLLSVRQLVTVGDKSDNGDVSCELGDVVFF